jgi:hypothetical protein
MIGKILRLELKVLLQHKIFSKLYREWEGKVDMGIAYPTYLRIYATLTTIFQFNSKTQKLNFSGHWG